MLVHAQHRWPNAINASLWPYALQMANHILNDTIHSAKDPPTPLQIFSSSKIQTELKHYAHFGCPAYVLSNAAQSYLSKPPKWDNQARLGVYLGPSPQYARNVALLLSLTTGYISPQFHVRLDIKFETITNQKIKSERQRKCSFIKRKPAQTTKKVDDV